MHLRQIGIANDLGDKSEVFSSAKRMGRPAVWLTATLRTDAGNAPDDKKRLAYMLDYNGIIYFTAKKMTKNWLAKT